VPFHRLFVGAQHVDDRAPRCGVEGVEGVEHLTPGIGARMTGCANSPVEAIEPAGCREKFCR
jgi:hypothetical protein